MYLGTLPQVIHEGYELKDFGRKVVDGVKYIGKGAYKIGGGLVGAATGAAAGAGIGIAAGAAAGSEVGNKLLSVPGAVIGTAAGIPLGGVTGAWNGLKYGARTGYALAGKHVGQKINHLTPDDYDSYRYNNNKYNLDMVNIRNPKGGLAKTMQNELYNLNTKKSKFFGKMIKKPSTKDRMKSYEQEWTITI